MMHYYMQILEEEDGLQLLGFLTRIIKRLEVDRDGLEPVEAGKLQRCLKRPHCVVTNVTPLDTRPQIVSWIQKQTQVR